MADFSAIQVEAKEGDLIEVEATRFFESDNKVMLLDKDAFDRFQQQLSDMSDLVVAGHSGMATLTPESKSWDATVPGDGEWYVVYQNWRGLVSAKVKAK